MNPRLVQFSAVVAGHAHNPTILNPDFLLREGIVPNAWNWGDAVEKFTTPPLAVVRYDNNVQITVDQGKLQVADPNVEAGPEQSKVTEIASAYVNTLPHVRYAAVGNNFQSLLATDDANDRIKNLFVKDGPWSDSPASLDTVTIKLVYPLEAGGRFTLSLDAGEAKLPDNADAQPVIMCNGNFSRDCPTQPSAKEVLAHLAHAMNDWAMFRESLTTIFDIND